MRKVFNYISILCIGTGLLISLLFLGSNFELKYSSAVVSIFYGVIFSVLFWGLGYFVDKYLSKSK